MLRTLIALGLIILAASPSFAGPPLNGTYFSVDIGGSVLTGRATESWPADPADGSRGVIGNTVTQNPGTALWKPRSGPWPAECSAPSPS